MPTKRNIHLELNTQKGNSSNNWTPASMDRTVTDHGTTRRPKLHSVDIPSSDESDDDALQYQQYSKKPAIVGLRIPRSSRTSTPGHTTDEPLDLESPTVHVKYKSKSTPASPKLTRDRTRQCVQNSQDMLSVSKSKPKTRDLVAALDLNSPSGRKCAGMLPGRFQRMDLSSSTTDSGCGYDAAPLNDAIMQDDNLSSSTPTQSAMDRRLYNVANSDIASHSMDDNASLKPHTPMLYTVDPASVTSSTVTDKRHEVVRPQPSPGFCASSTSDSPQNLSDTIQQSTTDSTTKADALRALINSPKQKVCFPTRMWQEGEDSSESGTEDICITPHDSIKDAKSSTEIEIVGKLHSENADDFVNDSPILVKQRLPALPTHSPDDSTENINSEDMEDVHIDSSSDSMNELTRSDTKASSQPSSQTVSSASSRRSSTHEQTDIVENKNTKSNPLAAFITRVDASGHQVISPNETTQLDQTIGIVQSSSSKQEAGHVDQQEAVRIQVRRSSEGVLSTRTMSTEKSKRMKKISFLSRLFCRRVDIDTTDESSLPDDCSNDIVVSEQVKQRRRISSTSKPRSSLESQKSTRCRETLPLGLLGPPHPNDTSKVSLILDLDETLVHSSFEPIPNPDIVLPIDIEGIVHNVYVSKRPGCDEFLRAVGHKYEICVFTASLSKYADPLLDLLDPHNLIRWRLFRESCVFHQGSYVKDLSILGRDLGRVIILDNSPASYLFQPENALPCSSYFDDPTDRELYILQSYLLDLKEEIDVRVSLAQWNSSLYDVDIQYEMAQSIVPLANLYLKQYVAAESPNHKSKRSSTRSKLTHKISSSRANHHKHGTTRMKHTRRSNRQQPIQAF